MGIESNILKYASKIRGNLVRLSHMQKIPHLASSLSCVDILTAAYFGDVLNISSSNVTEKSRDRFILSKGHAGASLYATLFEKGILEEKTFWSTSEFKSPLAEQPAPYCAPGVEWATGSLGHGLSAGIGMCLASKIQGNPFKVMVLMGDGECNEGSVWEAAMFAPAHKLKNLLVVVDCNQWQATGRTKDILSLDPIKEKFEAFGWNSLEVDGHDIKRLIAEMQNGYLSENGKPTAIVANCIKGKGVSFMEDDNNWHYRTPNEEEVVQAFEELGLPTIDF
jgi:transketolase